MFGTAGFLIVAMAVVGLQTAFDWLGGSLTAIARKDPTIEGINWVSLREDLTARGLLRPGTVIGVPNWRDAGKIGYALGPEVTVLCLNPDSRQFGFAAPLDRFMGQDVLVLSVTQAPVATLFERLEPLPDSLIRHRGRVLQTVTVSIGHGLTAGSLGAR